MFSRALGRSKAVHHETIGMLRFDLYPISRARLLILALLQLCDHAFEAALLNRIEELLTHSLDVIGVAYPAIIIVDQFPQHRLTLDEWEFHEVVAVDVQQIESIEINGNLRIRSCYVFSAREVNAGLNELKMRLSIFIQRDDFAIQHYSVDGQSIKSFGQRRETVSQSLCVSRPQIQLGAIFHGDGADPVQL